MKNFIREHILSLSRKNCTLGVSILVLLVHHRIIFQTDYLYLSYPDASNIIKRFEAIAQLLIMEIFGLIVSLYII
eukprot:snap_masked-scaffold_54-processed-gene-0.10-mRNA-1 protein AED:1.00 eAED:1.00 QI:0/0/0/0/1/1/2/0/74